MRYATFSMIVLAVAVGWILALPVSPVEQPLAFNHAKHTGMGCTVCHRGATDAARAGIADGATCLNCHATAPAPVAAAVWGDIVRTGRIEWVRVSRVPDHVFFSHRRHAALGKLECASCHGDIEKRSAPPVRAPLRLDMDACLSCHRREGASEDCAACHR